MASEYKVYGTSALKSNSPQTKLKVVKFDKETSNNNLVAPSRKTYSSRICSTGNNGHSAWGEQEGRKAAFIIGGFVALAYLICFGSSLIA